MTGDGATSIALIILPVFGCVWLLIVAVIAQTGWTILARRFRHDRRMPFEADRYQWRSLTIGQGPNRARYSHCVNIWVDDEAVYLRTPLFFRPFHPRLRLPWQEVVSVEPQSGFMYEAYEMTMKQGAPLLTFHGSSGSAIFSRWWTVSEGKPA